jgi:phage shock protein A
MMADSLAVRVTRIMAGSAHAFLDAVEDMAPEAMMRQAIRELEQVLAEVRVDLGKVEAGKHLVVSQMTKLNDENELLSAQIDTALSQGKEDLARAGVERQTLIEDQTPVLQRSLAEQNDRASELEGYITGLLAKRREMEEVLKEYLVSQASVTSVSTAAGKGSKDSKVESAQSSFDRVLSRQTGVSGMVGSATGDAVKLRELQETVRRQRVDEKLAALKAKLGK